MSSIKENLQVQASGVVVGVQEKFFNIKTWFIGLPQWQRVLLTIYIVILIPGFFAIRYGTEIFLVNQYARSALVAQPAFNNPSKLQVSKVNILKNANDTYTAYAIVQNPNLDLALDELAYTFTFTNSSGKELYTISGTTYLLPDQKRWLVVPRIQSQEPITTGKISFEEPNWQKRLNLPEVELRMSEPYVYTQDEPSATVAEGAVVNNSPYLISQANLLLVLYDKQGQVLAVTPRQENRLEPYERRAYKLSWPGIPRESVDRIVLEAYTNTMDGNNILYQSQAKPQNSRTQN